MSAPARSQLEAMGLSANCVDVLHHLWDYLDDEVTPAGAQRLKAHIESCEQCRAYEGFQAGFLEELAKLRRESDAPTNLREKVAEQLKREGCGCWEKVRKSV